MARGAGAEGSQTMSAVELVSLGGYSLFLAWTFVTFFWMFHSFPPDVAPGVRDFGQFAIFAGMAMGYVILHLLGRSSRFSLFSSYSFGFQALGSIILPIVAFTMHRAFMFPFSVVCVAGFLAGIAGASIMVSWLDVLSRLKTDAYERFTGLAFVLGTVLFVAVVFLPDDIMPVASVAYALFSIFLVIFASQNVDGDEAAPLESTENTWTFTKEIEPSFFMFGVVFALDFVYLFNVGSTGLLIGLLAIIPGAIVTVALGMRNERPNITVAQRALLVIAVVTCVVLPFVDRPLQIACAFVAVGAWAAFKTINYSFVVRKATVMRSTPFFRQAPLRLAVSSAGFALGWGIAALVTVLAGDDGQAFMGLRLAAAVVLVMVVMAFFPAAHHHPVDGTAHVPESEGALVNVSMDESELFEARCAAIVKLYRLSPRESDVFRYLARGRNAVWIQEELVVSPHTVKSHIYNIYRKMDIHSQQKLMTFVEEYPLDARDLKAAKLPVQDAQH